MVFCKNKKGFTLVEILVVIGIIALLSTLAMTAVSLARKRMNESKAQHEVSELNKAIAMMANDVSEWPGHQIMDQVNAVNGNEICGDGCTIGISSSTAGIVANDGVYSSWNGPYMRSIPLDPWGNQYFFDTDYQIDADNNPLQCSGINPHDAVVVGSYGPDGDGLNDYTCDDIIIIIMQ